MQSTFAEAEVNCLPPSTWPHPSQLFFSGSKNDLEYVLSLVQDVYPEESYWTGIDDRNGDEEWITSLSHNYSQASNIFNNVNSREGSCGFVEPGYNGAISMGDCTYKKHYVCETDQLNKAPSYPCPTNYIPYKNMCLMPNPQRETYENAQVFCANRGGIVLPIRDRAQLEFIKAWGPRSIRNDIWVGLRKKRHMTTYDENLTPPLQEEISDELTYSNGELFDVLTDYKMEATILRGECFALRLSENMELRDMKCNRAIGFVCEWIRPICPEADSQQPYLHFGKLSYGRDCFGVGNPGSFEDATCNSPNDLLRVRWNPRTRHEIDLYRRVYG